jgi:type I restriction enzyme, S subunit
LAATEALRVPSKGLPEGWLSSPLGELVEFALGGQWGEASSYRELEELVPVRVIRGTEFRNWSDDKGSAAALRYIDRKSLLKRRLQLNDLVIEVSGGGPGQPVGRALLIDKEALAHAEYPMICSNFCRQVRLKPAVDPAFVTHYLYHVHAMGRLDKYQTSSTNIRNLAFPKLLTELEIPFPPLPEQRRIVAKLDELMAEIKATKAHLAKAKEILKQFRQAVLNAAVTGKLTEEWRSRQANFKPARESINNALQHREKFWPLDLRFHKPIDLPKQSGDNLPDGWEWTYTDQIAACSLGKMLDRTKHRTGVPLPYLRNENVRWDRIETDDISEMFFRENEASRYLVEKGDLLICEGGEPGRCSMWDGSVSPMMYQKALHRVRMLSGTPARWILYCLSHDAATGHLEKYITGSGIRHFTGRALAEYMIPFPPSEEQVEIIRRAESLLAGIALIDEQCTLALAVIDRQSISLFENAFAGIL